MNLELISSRVGILGQYSRGERLVSEELRTATKIQILLKKNSTSYKRLARCSIKRSFPFLEWWYILIEVLDIN